MGMRSGFKKAAGSVSGQKKKSSWVGSVLTLVIIVAAVGWYFTR